MKKFERIFLYSVLAILVFHLFLVDEKAESQLAIQEEIIARSIVIVDKDGYPVIMMGADEDDVGAISIYDKGNPVISIGVDKDGGLISVGNKESFVVSIGVAGASGGGIINVSNKEGFTANMGAYEDGGAFNVSNKENLATAIMGVNKDHGNGYIVLVNKDNNFVAGMSVDENDSGIIEVYNKSGERIGSLP